LINLSQTEQKRSKTRSYNNKEREKLHDKEKTKSRSYSVYKEERDSKTWSENLFVCHTGTEKSFCFAIKKALKRVPLLGAFG